MLSFLSKPASKASVNSVNENKLESLLTKHVPGFAVSYCLGLWKEQPFSFKVTRSRNSCLGNYKFEAGNHTIAVNNDLNPYSFLITYIHEVAHMYVQLENKNFRRRPQPHGQEWKRKFQDLFAPLLNEEVFPEELLYILIKHMRNPAASSTRDPLLVKALREFDKNAQNLLQLESISIGETFIFKDLVFQKLESRRSRALCLELQSKRKYTIPLLAEIKRTD
jgi:hypothetical protein